MTALDWGQTVTIPASQIAAAEKVGTHLRHAVWIFSRLPYIVMILLMIAVTFAWWLARRRSRTRHSAARIQN